MILSQADNSLSKSPLKDAVTKHLAATTIVFFVVCMWATGFYTCHIWIRVYMVGQHARLHGIFQAARLCLISK